MPKPWQHEGEQQHDDDEWKREDEKKEDGQEEDEKKDEEEEKVVVSSRQKRTILLSTMRITRTRTRTAAAHEFGPSSWFAGRGGAPGMWRRPRQRSGAA